MQGQRGFWDVEDRLKELSAEGDPLERLSATVDFEIFRPLLEKAVRRSGTSKGGRPGFDAVLKFRMLVLQALHGLSLQQTDYLVRDRLSWMRFCGLGPGDAVPDANTLWDFREALIKARALERLDKAINDAATCRCRARSWTPRWLPPRCRGTLRPKRPTSKRAAFRSPGRMS